jgi:hypothetical protein
VVTADICRCNREDSEMSKIQVSKTRGTRASKAKAARHASAAKPQRQKAQVDSTAGTDRVSKRAERGAVRPAIYAESKQAAVVGMLSQPKGATIEAIIEATGWQKHSVRGFMSAVVRKKLGLSVKSEKTDGERRYRIEGRAAEKPSPSTSPSRRAKTTSLHAA